MRKIKFQIIVDRNDEYEAAMRWFENGAKMPSGVLHLLKTPQGLKLDKKRATEYGKKKMVGNSWILHFSTKQTISDPGMKSLVSISYFDFVHIPFNISDRQLNPEWKEKILKT